MAVHLESRPFHKPLTPAHWPPSDVLRLRGGGVPPAARAQAAGQSVRPRQPRFWLESLAGVLDVQPDPSASSAGGVPSLRRIVFSLRLPARCTDLRALTPCRASPGCVLVPTRGRRGEFSSSLLQCVSHLASVFSWLVSPTAPASCTLPLSFFIFCRHRHYRHVWCVCGPRGRRPPRSPASGSRDPAAVPHRPARSSFPVPALHGCGVSPPTQRCIPWRGRQPLGV